MLHSNMTLTSNFKYDVDIQLHYNKEYYVQPQYDDRNYLQLCFNDDDSSNRSTMMIIASNDISMHHAMSINSLRSFT